MRQTSSNETVLGLDLGSNSLGWALLEFEGNKPKAIIDCGVRIFQAGLEGDIESGNAVSRARERREKRSLRRQTDRRKRRRLHLLHLLQGLQILPEGTPEEVFPTLDKSLDREVLPDRRDSQKDISREAALLVKGKSA